MHEMGYCDGVLDAVEDRAAGRPVARIGVRVGSLHRIVPDAFEQSFQMMAAGGVADGAATEVTIVPARGIATPAAREFTTTDPPVACPPCGELRGPRRGRRRAGPGMGRVPRRTEAEMCLAIPGEVVELLPGNGDQLALVDVVGVKRKINIGLLEDDPVVPGDWVLIHVGFAMSKVDEKEAAEALRMLELMGQAFTDELQAVAESRIE